MSSSFNNTPSNARAFFEQIIDLEKGGYDFLVALVTDGADENEWREFKGVKTLTTPYVGRDVKADTGNLKRIWSKHLGAFANASGGVLIWGIDCPDRKAEGLSLAYDAVELQEQLIAWLLDAVEPRVPRVEVKAVVEPGNKRGFVVCYIPESRFAPHRSIFSKREFYQRCQDGSKECSYATLRRLFQPTVSPIIVPTLTLQRKSDLIGSTPVGIVTIWNKGYGSAHDMRVVISGATSIEADGISKQVIGSHIVHHCRDSVHPGQGHRIGVTGPRATNLTSHVPIEFTTVMFVRDAQPFAYKFIIPWSDVPPEDAKLKVATSITCEGVAIEWPPV